MITTGLYSKALIEPIRQGANKLFIVSGYASANMASKHIKDIIDNGFNVKINLIVGMCPLDGIDAITHRGFLELIGSSSGIDFECKYVYQNPTVHSKVYVWCKDDEPMVAFIGSANYSQSAFSTKRKEVLTLCEPESAYNYYEEIEANTIFCNHGELENYIKIARGRIQRRGKESSETEIINPDEINLDTNDKITLSLLQKGGDVGIRSGLNWGQRPGREPNQAYIPLPSKIAKSRFFPLNKAHFTVLTDDNKFLILRVEQQNDKAITTPLNNSLMGEYFRNRLGLANGQYISKEDLERYGRTDVDFYKVDDETFCMDFSTSI